MGDSPNVQQGESEEKTCEVYYFSDSSDDGEYGFDHDNSYDKSIWENTVESSDSDGDEKEKFTLNDFYSKWQSQPCTSMEICEYEDDEKRVGIRPKSPNRDHDRERTFTPGEDKIVEAFIGMIRKRNTHNKKEETDSESGDGPVMIERDDGTILEYELSETPLVNMIVRNKKKFDEEQKKSDGTDNF